MLWRVEIFSFFLFSPLLPLFCWASWFGFGWLVGWRWFYACLVNLGSLGIYIQ